MTVRSEEAVDLSSPEAILLYIVIIAVDLFGIHCTLQREPKPITNEQLQAQGIVKVAQQQ